jgi:hypothetical protein
MIRTASLTDEPPDRDRAAPWLSAGTPGNRWPTDDREDG